MAILREKANNSINNQKKQDLHSSR